MTTLTQVLEVNWIILYFVYGLVFFITGLVTGLQWRRSSQLEFAGSLPWLAAFGIAHGFNEWGYIFIPLQALYLSETAVRLMVIFHLMLLAVSFFFLCQFGVELILPLVPRARWLRAVPGIVLLLWGAGVFIWGASSQDSLNVLIAVGDGWSRYFLCLPGAVLASIGLCRQGHQMRNTGMAGIAVYLQGAGMTFAVYALVGGLIVPAAPTFLASLLNYSLLDQTIHIPAPVFRSICGLGMAFFVVRSLEVFQVETERRLAEMEQTQLLATDRERIGRELHDGIVQNIYATGLALEDTQHLVFENPGLAQQRIRWAMASLNRTIEDIRSYIFDLRTAQQTRELESILEGLVQDLRLDTFLEVDLEVAGQRCCWLDAEQVTHVTQVAREALSNVVQHAEARHVTVKLSYLGGQTLLSVVDDGKGMDISSLSDPGRRGQGLANMQKRAQIMGGDLILESEPGSGVRLVLAVPCDGNHGLLHEIREVKSNLLD